MGAGAAVNIGKPACGAVSPRRAVPVAGPAKKIALADLTRAKFPALPL